MRVYLVVMDETAEARRALRFAARRAARTQSLVHILALAPPQGFNAFGAVQATIEQEARERAEVLAASEAGNIFAETGRRPVIAVRQGEPQAIIREYLDEYPNVAALVLAASATGGPGPLVTHFSAVAGTLPCPLYIVPGGMTDEALDEIA
ncbi:universal stress protein [Erythrobacteraceae bacterium CFH 75059]|uniref:universal stress protein n=1 Tax=Qipengyuania thermophila TaxID=2509361 RepID=UPI0010229723|nr:universal stress protein [Qipengyuania thermophila]TCD05196.1 universal stress protein [Erythrobacteraceae bacterium CFH 75059]